MKKQRKWKRRKKKNKKNGSSKIDFNFIQTNKNKVQYIQQQYVS